MGENTGEGTTRKTGLQCEAIFLFQGNNLDTAPDTNIYGNLREIVQGYSYGDITATFRMSSDYKEKEFFETWQRLAYNPQTWSMGYYDDYTGATRNIHIRPKDRRRYGVELIECFPKNEYRSTIIICTTSNSKQIKISVTFSYRYWKNLTDEARLT